MPDWHEAAAGFGFPDVTGWWPYAREFPGWHVWQGVAGLVYASRTGSSPPLVVRGIGPADLRERIRRIEQGPG